MMAGPRDALLVAGVPARAFRLMTIIANDGRIKMPLYQYSCRGCGLEEERLAGVDHRTVVCTECGEIMDRQTDYDDALCSYWQTPARDDKALSA